MRTARSLSLGFVLCLLVAPALVAADADEAAIRKTHDDFTAAWNRHDATAMAAGWAEDGDLVNPAGRVANGRTEVQKIFAEEQAGAFKTSTFTNTITGIKRPSPTVAVVRATYEIANAMPEGATAPVTLKGHYLAAMVKKQGRWWITSALAMSPVPAGPPAHH